MINKILSSNKHKFTFLELIFLIISIKNLPGTTVFPGFVISKEESEIKVSTEISVLDEVRYRSEVVTSIFIPVNIGIGLLAGKPLEIMFRFSSKISRSIEKFIMYSLIKN